MVPKNGSTTLHTHARKVAAAGGTQAQAPDAAYNCLKSHAQHAGPEVA